MSADDNLRDALIEAFVANIREQAHRDGDYVRQIDDGLQFDGTMYVAELADIALKVVADWSFEPEILPDPFGIGSPSTVLRAKK